MESSDLKSENTLYDQLICACQAFKRMAQRAWCFSTGHLYRF